MTPKEFKTIENWLSHNPELKGEFIMAEEPDMVELKLSSKTPKGYEYVIIQIEIENENTLESHTVQ